jgi:hypothetical protein
LERIEGSGLRVHGSWLRVKGSGFLDEPSDQRSSAWLREVSKRAPKQNLKPET